ncbi:MAG TPA: helix-turn-helix domain-containing protein [Acidobacteriota bacterium]|nr:helix-turn-helix domain-containing protein [Acidobacteriota bacterium]
MIRHRKSLVKPPPPSCPLDECMRLVGGTWTPNIIWYLRENPRRFMELKGDLKGISAKTLTARLRRMEKDGVVSRQERPTSPPTVWYSLTDLGRRLLPAIEAIAAVGLELKGLSSSE